MSKFFLFAGELSGDKLGESIMKKLQGHELLGVGGPKMRAQGLKCTIPTESFLVMGFIDILKHLPRLCFLFYKIRKQILKGQIDTVILIDYAEFNLKLASSLRKKGYRGKIIQYVCPSVWAWRKHRIEIMESTLDEVMTLFPFEVECFTKLKATFVGHPLAKLPLIEREPKYLTIFPGSRTKEIQRNLPLQLKVAKRLSQHIAISVSHDKHRTLIEKLAPGVLLFSGSSIIKETESAIATSGTICLELALAKVPTLVTYAITPLDLFIAQKIFKIKLPHYCIVNIIAGKELFPEFFGPHFTEENLMKGFKTLSKEAVETNCDHLRKILSGSENDFSVYSLRQENYVKNLH
ncbi:MAG: lipid-A-disaccharide synthase [Simkaniaceae bacterium]|nr:lipid-A-disaccharide synthase [Simkaniaceae bacterium]